MDFAHSYEVQEQWESSTVNSSREVYFPHPFDRRKMDGLTLKVMPVVGEFWIGRFSFGDRKSDQLTKVMSCPNPQRLCVVCSGAGHWVDVLDPGRPESIGIFPIKAVKAIPERGIIVFSDFARLIGYGTEGCLWVTERASWDGLKIRDVEGDLLGFIAWDSPSQKEVSLFVNLRDGRISTSDNDQSDSWSRFREV